MAFRKNALKKGNLWFHLLDVALNILIIVAVVAGIRTFLISPFQVEGSSMDPTLNDDEYIIINKLAYHLGEPERGDIVVFHPPNNDDKFYVKRVIGMPGDTVTLRDGYVYIQKPGEKERIKLTEAPYLDEKSLGHTFRHPPGSGDRSPVSYTVPDDKYFLLGDNRQGSLDSRSFEGDGKRTPFVPDEAISGRVWFVALPVTKIHAFEAPRYAIEGKSQPQP